MISAPKGVLRLTALKLLSESSLSGTDLAKQVERVSSGVWKPGPGSVYLILGELLNKGMIVEVAKREGNRRRYIISAKGKTELSHLASAAEEGIGRQLKLLSLYAGMADNSKLQSRLLEVVKEMKL
jgi:DNA-binding PadR family transcriptional regulator